MIADAGMDWNFVGTSGQMVDEETGSDQQTAEDGHRREQGHSRDEESPRFVVVRRPRCAVHGEILPDLHLGSAVAVVHCGQSSIHWTNNLSLEADLSIARHFLTLLDGCPLQRSTATSNQAYRVNP